MRLAREAGRPLPEPAARAPGRPARRQEGRSRVPGVGREPTPVRPAWLPLSALCQLRAAGCERARFGLPAMRRWPRCPGWSAAAAAPWPPATAGQVADAAVDRLCRVSRLRWVSQLRRDLLAHQTRRVIQARRAFRLWPTPARPLGRRRAPRHGLRPMAVARVRRSRALRPRPVLLRPRQLVRRAQLVRRPRVLARAPRLRSAGSWSDRLGCGW